MKHSPRLVYPDSSADFPNGCVAVLSTKEIEPAESPILQMRQFLRSDYATSLCAQHGAVVFEDLEATEQDLMDDPEMLVVPNLSRYNLPHHHTFHVGIHSNNSNRPTYILSDTTKQEKNFRNAVLKRKSVRNKIENLEVDETIKQVILSAIDEGSWHDALIFLAKHVNDEAAGEVVNGISLDLQKRSKKDARNLDWSQFPSGVIGAYSHYGRYCMDGEYERTDTSMYFEESLEIEKI